MDLVLALALASSVLAAELAVLAPREKGSAPCGFARAPAFADLTEFSKYRCSVSIAAKGEPPIPMRPTWPRHYSAAGRCVGSKDEKGACQSVRRCQGSGDWLN